MARLADRHNLPHAVPLSQDKFESRDYEWELIFDWLSSEDVKGKWAGQFEPRQDEGTRHYVVYFSDPDAAFHFKMRFG